MLENYTCFYFVLVLFINFIMSQEKKFEACVIRTEDDLFIVAEWNQLVTAAGKSKLRVGSCVGYRKSAKKREKVIRGTIVNIGK